MDDLPPGRRALRRSALLARDGQHSGYDLSDIPDAARVLELSDCVLKTKIEQFFFIAAVLLLELLQIQFPKFRRIHQSSPPIPSLDTMRTLIGSLWEAVRKAISARSCF